MYCHNSSTKITRNATSTLFYALLQNTILNVIDTNTVGYQKPCSTGAEVSI